MLLLMLLLLQLLMAFMQLIGVQRRQCGHVGTEHHAAAAAAVVHLHHDAHAIHDAGCHADGRVVPLLMVPPVSG